MEKRKNEDNGEQERVCVELEVIGLSSLDNKIDPFPHTLESRWSTSMVLSSCSC